MNDAIRKKMYHKIGHLFCNKRYYSGKLTWIDSVNKSIIKTDFTSPIEQCNIGKFSMILKFASFLNFYFCMSTTIEIGSLILVHINLCQNARNNKLYFSYYNSICWIRLLRYNCDFKYIIK